MIPLYKLPQNFQTTWGQLITLPLANSAHPGLIFDKFPDGWVHNQNGIKLQDGEGGAKEKFYKETAERDQKHLKDGLKHAISQQKMLVKALSGEKIILQTDWRFITGMGNSHPYETGFTWHTTLGVPYLSGSSIKGILREWISNWADIPSDDSNRNAAKAEVNRLLGSENTDNPQVGSVVIFDALPVSPPKLEVDILNPHYQEYYTKQENPPADYYNPVPIKFLTIAAGESFLFSMAARRPNSETATDDINKCAEYLSEALNTIGAGGKTAVGYGVFSESLEESRKRQDKIEEKNRKQAEEDANKKAEVAAEKSGLPESLQAMIQQQEQENWRTDNAKFYAGVEQWLPAIKQEEKPVQQEVASILAEILENYFKGIMSNPDKMRGKKGKTRVYKQRPADIAKLLLLILGK